MILVYGLLPLLVFVIVDLYAGLKWALASALVLGVADVFLTKASLGVWDPGSFVALGLIAGLGAYSWKTKNPLWFKLQPTVLAGLFALILIYFQFFGVPIGTRYMPLITPEIPAEYREVLSPEHMERVVNLGGTVAIFVFLLHGLLCALAAFKWSNWAWLVTRASIWILIAVAGIGVGIFSSLTMSLHG
jgi:hypothetical protein